MDKRVEKLSELTGRTTGSIFMNKNNDNFSLDIVFQFAEWMAEQAFIAGAEWNDDCNVYINEDQSIMPIDYEQWLKKFKKKQ